jgi:hypothetical protein
MPGIILQPLLINWGYYVAGSYQFQIQDGTRTIEAWVQAAGGSGKGRNDVDGSAGGGGGFSYFYRDVVDSDWSANLTITVGAGAANTNGGNSSITGTLNGSSITVTAVGGNRGTTLVDGTGGSASGGDTNLAGEDGYGYVVTPIDERAPGTPGRSGGQYNNGGADPFPGADSYTIFGPGHGGIASGPAGDDQPGFDGYVILKWI